MRGQSSHSFQLHAFATLFSTLVKQKSIFFYRSPSPLLTKSNREQENLEGTANKRMFLRIEENSLMEKKKKIYFFFDNRLAGIIS